MEQHKKRVTLSYTPKATLTDDIANMSRFICMIRADSNLSGPIVEGSKTVEIDIFPTKFSMSPDWRTLSISEVRMVQNRNRITNTETDYPKPVVQGRLPRFFFERFYEYSGIIQKNRVI